MDKSIVSPFLTHSVLVSVQCLTQLVAHRVFTKSVFLLCDEQCTKIVFNALEGNYALCLLGELFSISFLHHHHHGTPLVLFLH